MDQLGNAEPTTEEPSSEDRQPEGQAGGAEPPSPPCTVSVYRAELAAVSADEEAAAVPDDGPAETIGTAGTADAAPARSDNSFHSNPGNGSGSGSGEE